MRNVPRVRSLWVWCALLAAAPASAQVQPIDLFADTPSLGDGFIRLGAWNLRHINLEGSAADFLAGQNREEDFAILTQTFAKSIRDLGLDLVAITEHQPRAGEPNRLHQIRDHLNADVAGSPWRADESAIVYDDGSTQFGGLQLAVLWNSDRVTIDPNANTLLEELRQPRDQNGNLTRRNLRAPWLVPVAADALGFDLLIVHLKSGGTSPQAHEVDALQQFIEDRFAGPAPRHLVLAGDWNIRPDRPSGRGRLERLGGSDEADARMRLLTAEPLELSLDQWRTLGSFGFGTPVADLVPFSHFNASSIDTFLDHIAISRTLDGAFSHPVNAPLAGGGSDRVPGIALAYPLIPESQYHLLTDHLPVVLTLRVDRDPAPAPPVPTPLRILAAVPNPPGADTQAEEVHLQNASPAEISLDGWRLEDRTGREWSLTVADGVVATNQTTIVLRSGRPMQLNNGSGDEIVLLDPQGTEVDRVSYPSAADGELIQFN